MSSARAVAIGVLGLTAALCGGAAAWARSATMTTASDARGFDASFTTVGVTTRVGPAADTGGVAPPAYTKMVSVADYDQPVGLVSAGPAAPIAARFVVTARQLVSRADAKGLQVDTARATATATIGSAELTLQGEGPARQTWLDVQAQHVAASASFSRSIPSPNTVTGSAAFGSLRIDGSLLGGKVVTVSGSEPANTVIYRSPTVTITADRQIPADVIPCAQCGVRPVGLTVRALEISLHDALILGKPVSGEIVLATAAAW